MKIFKKITSLMLILLALNLGLPRLSFSEEGLFAQADPKTHAPEVLSTPEEEIIPVPPPPPPIWPWVVGGVVIVAAAVAAALAFGSHNGSSGGSPNSGSVSVGW
jgi:hypothetical protein